MIKVIHYGLSAHLGGIETYLYKLTQHVDSSKVEFTFIWEGKQEPCFYNELKKSGCKFVRIVSRKKNFLKNKRQLKEIFEKGRYDVFHCHLNTLSYITPIKVALHYNCRVILHSRNGYADRTKFYSLWLHKMNFRWIYQAELTRVAVSDVAAEWLFGDKECTIINNGIDIERFRFNENFRDRIREELEIDDKVVYGTVGSFSLQKNHLFLLDVFSEIVQMNSNSILLLLGEGIQRERIEEKIKELRLSNNVVLLGNKREVEKYLWAMDVFLFPSLFEGFPNALLEAQTAGLPCLVADTITREVKILGSVRYLKLEEAALTWAKKAIKMEKNIADRKECADKIDAAGFNVIDEVRKIMVLYEIQQMVNVPII